MCEGVCAMGGGVVLFISVSELHFVVLRWCIGFSTKHMSLVCAGLT